jgi:hypothetical protein
MVEEQKYPRLIWRLVLVVDSRNLKFLKTVVWFVITLTYIAPGTCYHGFIFLFFSDILHDNISLAFFLLNF